MCDFDGNVGLIYKLRDGTRMLYNHCRGECCVNEPVGRVALTSTSFDSLAAAVAVLESFEVEMSKWIEVERDSD